MVLAVTAINAFFDHPQVQRRIDRFVHYYRIALNPGDLKSAVIESDHVRYDYIRLAVAQLKQKGHVFLGTGPGTFKYIKVDELDFDPPLMAYKVHWNKPTHAHNEYLTRWVERGLVGLGMHLLFLSS